MPGIANTILRALAFNAEEVRLSLSMGEFDIEDRLFLTRPEGIDNVRSIGGIKSQSHAYYS